LMNIIMNIIMHIIIIVIIINDIYIIVFMLMIIPCKTYVQQKHWFIVIYIYIYIIYIYEETGFIWFICFVYTLSPMVLWTSEANIYILYIYTMKQWSIDSQWYVIAIKLGNIVNESHC
jgi:hypothetical protein